jgi:hypothetical protein
MTKFLVGKSGTLQLEAEECRHAGEPRALRAPASCNTQHLNVPYIATQALGGQGTTEYCLQGKKLSCLLVQSLVHIQLR